MDERPLHTAVVVRIASLRHVDNADACFMGMEFGFFSLFLIFLTVTNLKYSFKNLACAHAQRETREHISVWPSTTVNHVGHA